MDSVLVESCVDADELFHTAGPALLNARSGWRCSVVVSALLDQLS